MTRKDTEIQMSWQHYDTLGVAKGASKEEIKRAYKKLAVQNHPDKGGDPEKFKEISNAYQILSDDDKRDRYDQLGDDGFNNMAGGGGDPFNGMDAHHIFEQMFGGGMGGMPFHFDFGFGGGGPRGPIKKKTHLHPIRISLGDAYNGVHKTIKVSVQRNCTKCREMCHNCQGRGQVTDMRRMGFITQMMQRACDRCQGTGSTSKGCNDCEGQGTYREEKKLELHIPSGVQSGHKLVFEGLGEQAMNENEIAGDLVFEIHVSPHEHFQRNGDDLLYNTTISFADSVVGKTISIPHFSGTVEVATHEFGILQPNKPYIIPGKGMPNGNLVLTFHIKYPVQKLSTEHRGKMKDLLTEMGLM